ncbi:interferon-induced protein with tetratricopeptide repeats 3 isoform X1 [Phyllostomus discolor]|uniref:Interferon-induced protein with tetratricopeptide repeats 3 isoform X1 n=1 Tax=Phyllostomus discolor TaxID=89673 RepID=A0A7E6DUL0_9CHIR|nr:interferon-induced protein with tetratricopeptide repeats 3 isoform X1 [Phyllostomus discolor]
MVSSEVSKSSLEKILPQLKCHFTWDLLKEESVSSDLEDRVRNQIEFLNPEFKSTMYNLLAYIKHLCGQNEAALECLQKAEESIQREHADQAEIRSLVTWGNYAWVYYHMGRLSEAQVYADKVKQVCKKYSNPYSIECPELDCEEGWTLLRCGGKQNEKVKVYFEKALEKKPNNPEFSAGLAIAMYRLDEKPPKQFCVSVLKKAIELSPDNQYVKVLLALKFQKINKEAEGEPLVVEALEKAPCQTDVLLSAAKFYKKKGDLDKAIELFQKALVSLPNNGYIYQQIASCYRAKEKQIQSAEDSEADRNREKVEELRKYAREYSNKATEKGLNPIYAYSDLTELETEECFETAFPEASRKQFYQGCSNFREYQGKSEDTSVLPHLNVLPINTKSTEKEKVKYQPQNGAKNQLQQNAPNSWYLQGLTHKMNGDLQQAAECFERELGRLLKNSPSGISSFFLPASELEDGHAEVGQGTDGFPLSELPDPGAETERGERRGEGEACNCHEGKKDGKAGVPQSELAD